MDKSFKNISEVDVEDDKFSLGIKALAGSEGFSDFIFMGYDGKKMGGSVINCKDGTMFVVLLYSLMMQYPEVFKLFLNAMIEMVVEGGVTELANAAMNKGKEKTASGTTKASDINLDDFIAGEHKI